MEEYPSGAESYLEELCKLVANDRGEGGSKRIISIGEIGLGQSVRLDQARDTQGQTMTDFTTHRKRYSSSIFLYFSNYREHSDYRSSYIPALQRLMSISSGSSRRQGGINPGLEEWYTASLGQKKRRRSS
jgi:hypothetical protein